MLAFAPATSAAGLRGAVLATAPKTGFEESGDWTTHEEELALLAQIANESEVPLRLEQIGTTAQGRPINLVIIGLGATGTADDLAKTMPATMILGSQHGNEPAGREANLKLIRDLAYMDLAYGNTDQATAVLAEQTLLIVPSANPDGRAANSRANSNGIDINRDHLTLVTEEASAFAQVILTWEPHLALDLHEYGPTTPVTYDDDLLYLWPRNLNVDTEIHDKAKEFCLEYIKADSEAAGYSADEYGLRKIGPNAGPVKVPLDYEMSQSAGDEDEGICRNTMGLRNSMGILVESATSAQGYRPDEVLRGADLRRRRVESQRVVLDAMLRFNDEQGDGSKAICDGARVRKATEGRDQSAPLYFNGADNDPSTSFQDPPPSGYQLTPSQLSEPALTNALDGQGITVGDDGIVSMAQHAEPIIGLLLDARGRRHIAEATPLD
jgi:hypothetical protein